MGIVATLLFGSTAYVAVAVADTGASHSAEQKILKAHGAAAADLRAPSAEVARVRAERSARQRAEKKLEAALTILDPKLSAKKVEELITAAQVAAEEFGSDGSVELDLQLSTEGLTIRPPRR